MTHGAPPATSTCRPRIWQATHLAGDADTVLALVRDIAAVHKDDGLVYDAGSATAEVIRDEEEYSGVRVRLIGHLSRAHPVPR